MLLVWGPQFHNFQSSLVILVWSTDQQGQHCPGAGVKTHQTLLEMLIHSIKPELAFHKISRGFVYTVKVVKYCSRASSKGVGPITDCENLLEGAYKKSPQSKQQKSRYLALVFPPGSPVCETDNIHPLETATLTKQGAQPHCCRCQLDCWVPD